MARGTGPSAGLTHKGSVPPPHPRGCPRPHGGDRQSVLSRVGVRARAAVTRASERARPMRGEGARAAWGREGPVGSERGVGAAGRSQSQHWKSCIPAAIGNKQTGWPPHPTAQSPQAKALCLPAFADPLPSPCPTPPPHHTHAPLRTPQEHHPPRSVFGDSFLKPSSAGPCHRIPRGVGRGGILVLHAKTAHEARNPCVVRPLTSSVNLHQAEPSAV